MELDVAERLRELVKAKGYTMYGLSQASGISVSTLHGVASGRSKPGYELIIKLHEAIPDLNLEWLITGRGSMFQDGKTLATPASAPAAQPPTNDNACWDLLKREEEQHQQLRSDYHELKHALQRANYEHDALLRKLRQLAPEELAKKLGLL
jgi:transcriptional regulator with XRE-family HTH domain